MSALSIHALSLAFRSPTSGVLKVLDDVDLEVREGELLSVIGPSGCGKTTLLHALDGLVEPSSGRIERAGRRLALVFQKPRLLPWRTILDNAAFGLECAGLPRRVACSKAAGLLERMCLSDHVRDFPHQISEGMKQRVNLARALLTDPDVLLMDEPFSALDLMTKKALMDELLSVWSERALTVVFVSHAIEEVAYLSDRVVVLSDKPTRIKEIVPLDLLRPRGVGPEGKLAMLSEVERIERILRADADCPRRS